MLNINKIVTNEKEKNKLLKSPLNYMSYAVNYSCRHVTDSLKTGLVLTNYSINQTYRQFEFPFEADKAKTGSPILRFQRLLSVFHSNDRR